MEGTGEGDSTQYTATIDITEYNVPVKFHITRRLQQLNL